MQFYNKHTCNGGESGIGRAEGDWKFPELTERKYVWFLSHAISVKSAEEFTHFSI